MKDNRLIHGEKIGHATVTVDILGKGHVIPNTKIVPTSITIHNTGNIGAPARNNHNYMKNLNKNGGRTASWHFTVDDKDIIQAQSCNYKCWHAGNAAGNNTSIGIEICMFNDKERQKKCYENAIALVKVLLDYFNWGTDKIKQHYNWTRKDCPTWLRSGKFGYNWDWFIGEIKKKPAAANPKPAEKPVASKPVENKGYVVKVLVDVLNVRKGPGMNYDVVSKVKAGGAYTIVEEKNGWGKLKSGIGWISLNSKYVKKL